MIRVNAWMSLLKSNETVLGGKMLDHWWRIEFQNRGSPHLHMLVWVENAPDFDTPEGVARIDQVVTCELHEDEETRALVESVQRHRHTVTCYKNGSQRCRFSFPRAVKSYTRIISNTFDEFIQNGGRICALKRQHNEVFNNNYSSKLMVCWKANMDIQPCGSNEAIAMYIAKYASKNEPTDMSFGLREAISRNRREDSGTSRKLFKICMKILHERQISACECDPCIL